MENKWYEVTVESDIIGRRGERALSRNRRQEIENWIVDHYQNAGLGFWKNVSCFVYAFRNEEAALAFRLRWGQ